VGFEKIIFEKQDGIGIITLNDPANRNTISGSIVGELGCCLDDCSDDPEVRTIVLRGEGKVFSAGGNINVMKRRIEEGKYHEFGPAMKKLAIVIEKLRNIRKPIIASVQGAAAGGGLGMIMFCDFRIVAEDAKLVFPFTNLGLIPDCGATLALLRMIGVAKTTELLMTSKLLSGKEAYEWGIVNQSVPAEKLNETTQNFAKTLAKGPTIAYGRLKTMINRLAFEGLDFQLENEAEYQELCARSEDHKQGVYAFIEKRKPVFKGI